MKVYVRNEDNKFYYPEDMKTILNYLKERGQVFVKDTTIENLYSRFSDEMYSAGWMSVYDGVLESFENWLSELEI